MASTYLTRTPSSNGNRQKWTWSGWTKRSGLLDNGSHYLFASNDGSNDYSMIAFASDSLRYYDYTGSSFSSQLVTNRLFRDTNAWYHIVVAYDSTQGTSSNRIKLYVNGVQETSLSTATYPSQNHNSYFNKSGYPNRIGSESGSGGFYDGSMSHIHFCDGTALAPTVFGSTDATTGEWKINTSPSFTLGTNGFTILKDGNTITDQSTNSNNFTLGAGTLSKTQDNPSNNFATWNQLIPSTTNYVYSNGNNTVNQTSGSWVKTVSTLGMTKGKYYWEVKTVSADTSAGKYTVIGVANTTTPTAASGMPANGIGYKSNGEVQRLGSITNIGAYTAGDIISCYLDMDNEALYYAKNGVMLNSGVPTSGSSKTGAFTMPVANSTYFASLSPYGTNSKAEANFGNGFFGTTAVATNSGSGYAGTDGKSIFNYQPASGYTALSTKGLNT